MIKLAAVLFAPRFAAVLLLCLLIGSDDPQCSYTVPTVFTYTNPRLPVYHHVSDDQVYTAGHKIPICSRHQNHWEGVPQDV
jgi:hypothetical protein